MCRFGGEQTNAFVVQLRSEQAIVTSTRSLFSLRPTWALAASSKSLCRIVAVDDVALFSSPSAFFLAKASLCTRCDARAAPRKIAAAMPEAPSANCPKTSNLTSGDNGALLGTSCLQTNKKHQTEKNHRNRRTQQSYLDDVGVS